MWKVGGIEIELAIGRQSFFETCKTQILTLRPVTRKRREILGWAIKGEKSGIHRGTNAFWEKIGCRGILTLFLCVSFDFFA